MPSPDRVEKHAIVTMQYSLVTDTGVVIREASGDPVRYIQGCGTLFPRLEAALSGHRVGDVVSTRLLPEDAFGKRDVDLLHEVPLSELPPGENIAPGGQLTGENETGEQVTFRITEVTDEIVKLDGNHALAGQTLIFEVEIQGLDQATAEEIRSGKVSDT